jgi:hypothetical protein
MPTVLRVDGFRILVHGPPREHPPPHAHVELGTSGLVVIRLATRTSPQKVWAVYNMKDRDVLRAYRLVEEHHDVLMQAWRAIHDETETD